MNPHGAFDIHTQDRIVDVRVWEAWNAEGMARFIEQFKAAARSLGDGPWAALIDLRDWELATPETEKQVDELQAWCIENGQSFEAVVVGDAALAQAQMQRYSQLITGFIEQRHFANREEARRWLLDKLG